MCACGRVREHLCVYMRIYHIPHQHLHSAHMQAEAGAVYAHVAYSSPDISAPVCSHCAQGTAARKTQLRHMCDMTYSCVRHAACVCVHVYA